MSSIKRTRELVKVASSSRLIKQNPDPLWSAENSQLKFEAEANSRLKEEISKQSYADYAVQADIKDKVQALKDTAASLAKTLQAEKRKNLELEAIIRHISHAHHEDKRVEATHRDDMNFESVDNLSRKIKKLEYDLEQMLSKFNDISSKNTEKKNQIDAFRTQRVIDSGIFLKMEKQLVDSETYYKKLLIQKTRIELQYNKNLVKYRQIKTDIDKQQFVTMTRRSTYEKKGNKEKFFTGIPEIQYAVKFTELPMGETRSKIERRTFLKEEAAKSQRRQELEYTVKKIFLETGLNDAESLIYFLHNIKKVNEELFDEVNKKGDAIIDLSQEIQKFRQDKNKKTIKYYEQEPQLSKNDLKARQFSAIQQEVSKIQANIEKCSSSLGSLKNNGQVSALKQVLELDFEVPQSVDDLNLFFASLEKQLNPLLLDYKPEVKQQPSGHECKKSVFTQIKDDTVDELIGKVKKLEQSEKIMFKEDFQKEYELIKTRNQAKSRTTKKKTTCLKKPAQKQ